MLKLIKKNHHNLVRRKEVTKHDDKFDDKNKPPKKWIKKNK